MTDNIREKLLLKEIEGWEQEHLYLEESLNDLHYEEWLGKLMNRVSPEIHEQYIEKVDSILFHFSSYIQNSDFLRETRKKIILNAKLFDGKISDLGDLKKFPIDQLVYLSNQQIAKQRLLSFVQGGISGSGSRLMTGLDVPASILIQLYAVQRIAMSYGYNVYEPYELMLTLKVFHLASLPKQFKYEYWKELLEEIKVKDKLYNHFFEVGESENDFDWDQLLMNQLSKVLVLHLLKKRFGKKLPLVSIVYGAVSNYRLTRNLTETANIFYQKRTINERLVE